MKITIDEYKLKKVITEKIVNFITLSQEKFRELNKDIDKTGISFTPEEFEILTNVPNSEWPSGFEKRAEEIIKELDDLNDKSDTACFTVEEILEMLNLTEEDIKSCEYIKSKVE